MRQQDMTELVPELIRTAHAAAARIMEVYDNGPVLTQWKADESPVTQADLVSHNSLVNSLSDLKLGWPVVSEEDESSLAQRRPDQCFWLLDPLDGTKEFLGRNGEFTVNIALIKDGRPVLGVVGAPALGRLYWGGQAMGAWRMDARGAAVPIQVARLQVAKPVRVVASRSHMDAATQAFIGRFGDANVVQAGSSLKFCLLAEGLADIYPRFGPTCEWDTAAAQAVLEGAGGVVVDLGGVPLSYGKPEVLNPFFVAACAMDAIPRD